MKIELESEENSSPEILAFVKDYNHFISAIRDDDFVASLDVTKIKMMCLVLASTIAISDGASVEDMAEEIDQSYTVANFLLHSTKCMCSTCIKERELNKKKAKYH